MEEKAKEIYDKLQKMHNILARPTLYPRYKEFNSALYDIDKNLLFSTLKGSDIDLDKNYFQKSGFSYFIYEMRPYYMGSAFIVIEQKTRSVFENLGKQILLLSIFVIFIIAVTSVFLVKLLLKPLRDNAALLDRFIKDTTHELNTPVSTILANIEMLENTEMEKNITKKVNRIKMASLTISNLYDDLVFLVLNHKVSSQNEVVDLNRLIKERVEYFDILFRSKKLEVKIEENGLLYTNIDRKKITRVIDNLISNSIKYTAESKSIKIQIEKNSFSIKDQGIGMSKEEVKKVFQRYTRFNTSNGGFGLGFNIIYTIAKEYDIDIKIDSKKNEGTCVTLTF